MTTFNKILYISVVTLWSVQAIDEKFCKDKYSWKDCNYYRELGYCNVYAERLKEICPVTCNLCDQIKEKSLECIDKDGPFNCQYLQRNGACLTHRSLMAHSCAKTCNLCDANRKCKKLNCVASKVCVLGFDNQPRCECPTYCPNRKDYKFLGQVCGTDGKTYANLCRMQEVNCRKGKDVTVASYGKCPTAEICEDRKLEKESGTCDTWKKLGLCSMQTYHISMKEFCPKTCGLCPERRQSYPERSCESSPFGCCWDFSVKPENGNCPECKETHSTLCKTHIRLCNSLYDRNQKFMRRNCPVTCGFCNPAKRKDVGIHIFNQAGNRLMKTYYS